MNAPAIAGQHRVVPAPRRRTIPWSFVITGSIITALLIAATHYSHLGPGINAETITAAQHLCKHNDGVRRIMALPAAHRYTITCRDGATWPRIEVRVADLSEGSRE